MGRGHHWEFPARDVATNGLHSYVFVTQDDPGESFNFNVAHRGALGFCETSNLDLRELDIFHVTGRYLLHRRLDFRLAEAKVVRCVAVKLY